MYSIRYIVCPMQPREKVLHDNMQYIIDRAE